MSCEIIAGIECPEGLTIPLSSDPREHVAIGKVVQDWGVNKPDDKRIEGDKIVLSRDGCSVVAVLTKEQVEVSGETRDQYQLSISGAQSDKFEEHLDAFFCTFREKCDLMGFRPIVVESYLRRVFWRDLAAKAATR